MVAIGSYSSVAATISGLIAFSRYRERKIVRRASFMEAPVLPSVLPFAAFGTARGFHRYQPENTPGLLPRDAVSYVLNPAHVPL